MSRSIRLPMPARAAPLLGLLACAGCAVNPVTGERELSLVSTADEISTGERYYATLQQAGGGLYTVDPALTEYVSRVGQKLTAVSDRRLPYDFVVLNHSTANAWALPGGKIAVTRGLLVELDNEAELAAVLAHEIVHAAARHGVHAKQRGLLGELVLIGAAVALKDSAYADVIVGAGGIGLNLVNRQYGRDAERESDYYGMKYMREAGYDTGAAVTLQEKFVALSESRESSWLEGLFASHPPSTERVENNRKAITEFPAGGTLGRAAYRARTAYLRARKDAYAEADRARHLLESHPGRALKAIDRALSREPREPVFYGIRGHALARQGRHDEAIRAYDSAIRRDPNYYEHYLGRGLALDRIGERAEARDDLTRSYNLLPTAGAAYSLGTISLAEGNREDAKSLFEEASAAGGEIGGLAREAYVWLDIVDAPGKYVSAQPFFAHGRVFVRLTNSTGYEIRDIAVHLDATVNGWSVYARPDGLDRLPGHGWADVETGLRYSEDARVRVTARVVGARPAD